MGCPPWLPPLSAQRPLDADSGAGISHSPRCFSEPVVLAASSGCSLDRYLLQLFFWVNSSFLDAQKPRILEALKTVYSPHQSPCQKTSIDLIDHTTSVMESLWSGQGLLRERWCCARGWWMMAVITDLSQEIHLTSFSRYFLVPHIMGILS